MLISFDFAMTLFWEKREIGFQISLYILFIGPMAAKILPISVLNLS
jgi:hypothetical protein